MIKLSADNIFVIKDILYKFTGGTNGIRDYNLLDMALNSCYQTFDGKQLYPTVAEKGVRLCFSLIKAHPFVDGNKRIGLLSMLTFFELNNVKTNFTDDELTCAILSLADGKINYDKLLDFVKTHIIQN